ncbi:MAG: alpha/beta hydrolase [Phycisphaerales bacterium]|nr:alpha/beta hydrolase [Phycisphaerales bacterium]
MDILGLLIVLLLGGLVAWLFCILSIAWNLTHPPRRGYTWALARSLPASPAELPPPHGPRRFETWTFRSSIGRGVFEAWDIPADNPAGPVCIFTHGWSDSRITSLDRLIALLPHCSRVVMWDLPAHADTPVSRSEPTPTWLRMGTTEVRDLLDLIATVCDGDRAGAPPRLVLAGFSLGAGMSIAAAAAADARSANIVGVIAEAPYRLPQTPARRVLALRGLPHGLTLTVAMFIIGLLARQGWRWRSPGGSFDRAEHAARLRCPLLLVHSRADAVCPIEDSQEIARRAGAGATLCSLTAPGHSEVWSHAEASVASNAVGAFIRSL